MTENPIITVLDKPERAVSSSRSCAEIISFELDAAGKTVHFNINVRAKKATLAEIVPLARKLSTKLAIAILDKLKENKQIIPCCKGCSACCSYMIPLSIPEVFHIREELRAMPCDYSRKILKSCMDTAGKILDKNLRTSYLKSFSKSGQPQINKIGKWYSKLKLACPFLSDGLCMIYEQRPLACREHIVTGSATLCHGGEPKVVSMPVSILEALGQLAAELENSDIEAVMLPLAFAWAEDNLQRAKQKWPAITMVKRFLEILQLKTSKNSAALILSN